jgi:hypothetical protein
MAEIRFIVQRHFDRTSTIDGINRTLEGGKERAKRFFGQDISWQSNPSSRGGLFQQFVTLLSLFRPMK